MLKYYTILCVFEKGTFKRCTVFKKFQMILNNTSNIMILYSLRRKYYLKYANRPLPRLC